MTKYDILLIIGLLLFIPGLLLAIVNFAGATVTYFDSFPLGSTPYEKIISEATIDKLRIPMVIGLVMMLIGFCGKVGWQNL